MDRLKQVFIRIPNFIFGFNSLQIFKKNIRMCYVFVWRKNRMKRKLKYLSFMKKL